MAKTMAKRSVWFISDHHLMHENVLKFTDEVGNKIRSAFKDLDTMNKFIVWQHNEIVNDDDLVYFGGDVIWKNNKAAVELLAQMKGQKRLVLGNHDDADFLYGTGLFQRMYLWKYFPNEHFIFSHVPLVERDLKRTTANVHGHIHEKVVQDKRYLNVSVENVKYQPVHMERIKKWVESLK